MYFLEENHPKYEYTLYVQMKSGKPYIGVWRATELHDVFREVGEIEKKHAKIQLPFYIDNDFYQNKFKDVQVGCYYKFMKRKVNDWETLETKENVTRLKFVK